ncbi:hypothetical protein A3B45_01790 [Candidatus Daviesbacteria bacterium RIFCSPLOWO2_01_FULL_39_12]|uniref:Membrane protein 6-pyruvoyl-tetrahydropterin synthase-related domain-containing protein n=1 Tax=Candidatus Daviesbacteria bacterium RIFCSPLOWO2_01_FULL_39_12 TaxID=1797785 RepID=A0A1F5KM26_9BACT|nr:MAG: hypothetical protein A3B45_01790 [Candidatus Daviesbacteria bacterium RIFCSPLOWO2_01_FULL_39_12]HLC97045.1 hypothetical protein [Candidatus Nanoarchaeia archaeon]
MRYVSKDLMIVLLLLVVSIPAIQSLFIPGGFTSHDLTHHVVRQISMDKLLSEGQFPPRWSGELNNGYGYPVFLFNYPLPAMVGEIFHKLGMGYVDSVKAVLFWSMVASVLGMYLFLNALLKDRLAAFTGAIFYLYAPIRFLNVYVSAAVGSALALGILPFVFWSLVEIKKGKKWATLVGGVSLAGLILAHNVTALIFASVILAFVWFLVRRVRELRVVGVMFLLGLGLSAWFWLPATFEAQYIRFAEIFGKFYQDQFPSLWQLIRSPWGYGLSHPQNPEVGDMSYQLGLIHIGVMLILAVLIWVRRGMREIKVIGGFMLAIFIISIFLMLKVSLPLWENLPFLALVQFPLRFSAISIFSASIAAALLIKWIPIFIGVTGKKIIFAILLLLVIYANRNHWNINEVFDPGEDYYLSLNSTSTTYGEHLPKWGKVMDKPSPGKLEFVRGIGEIKMIRDKSDLVLAEVETTQSAKLRLNQFYFPGWEIKIDSKKVDFNYLSDGESYGLPIFDIDAGKHLVKANFKNTPVRNLGDFITIITVIIFITIIFKIWKLLPRAL